MSRPQSEDLKNISIYRFKKWGLLDVTVDRVSSNGEISWSTNGNTTSTVGYFMIYRINVPIELHLSYSAIDSGLSHAPSISISTTQCNYGGRRYWFHCPKCHRRSAKLYFYLHELYCRICLKLTYESSNRSQSYRFLDMAFGTGHAQALEKRLEKTHRYYYAGKPTKTYAMLLRKQGDYNPKWVEYSLYGFRKRGRPQNGNVTPRSM